MFNLVIMNTLNKNDNTAVLIFVALFCVCCCCCCSSSIISSGGLFLKSDKKDEPTASPTAASKQYTLRSANTISNENGEGKVYYLDRHNVDCGHDHEPDGLNRFQLKTDNDNATMQYEYKCLTGLDTTDGGEHNTTPDVDGDPPHSVYLDRHTVDCGTKPITQFKLHRNSDKDKIFYKYHCAKGPNSNTCRDVTTNYNDQGGGNVIYLDRHAVSCNEGEYLSKFRLDADDNDTTGKYRYEYKCCKP